MVAVPLWGLWDCYVGPLGTVVEYTECFLSIIVFVFFSSDLFTTSEFPLLSVPTRTEGGVVNMGSRGLMVVGKGDGSLEGSLEGLVGVGGGVVVMGGGVVFGVVGRTIGDSCGDSIDELMLIRQQVGTLIRAVLRGAQVDDVTLGVFVILEELKGSGMQVKEWIISFERKVGLNSGDSKPVGQVGISYCVVGTNILGPRSIFLKVQGEQLDYEFLRVQYGVLAKVDSTFVITKDGNVVEFDLIVD
ncbi:hypothetical protein Tco_0454527 [Tanacetum coccineum]